MFVKNYQFNVIYKKMNKVLRLQINYYANTMREFKTSST